MSELITIRCGAMEASVDTAGAQLMNLRKDGKEYLWQRDPQWWPRCAPVLFPIVGNIRDDRADSAQGEIRFGRHGLARNYDFEVVEAVENSMTLSLSSNDDTRAAFPFDFRLNMTYALTDDALEQRFTVTNTGDVTLPFVVGGHPAFNVPAPGCEDEEFGDYVLKFAQPWTYASPTINTTTGLIDYQTRFGLVEDSDTLALSHRLFDVDTLIFEDVPGRTVSMVGPSGHGMRVDFEGFDYLGVWSAANDAPFVALEPWRGTATGTDEDDVFEHKRGMDFLEPGETAEYAFFMLPL
ncbi:MAG: aldose 1-epimerase family protein [Atopobiaceae bacterium]|jgi:galactose mutarotase-like enzyme|nr:aldose 1-epimerase family protein [Atopobiaceae bacterium]